MAAATRTALVCGAEDPLDNWLPIARGFDGWVRGRRPRLARRLHRRAPLSTFGDFFAV